MIQRALDITKDPLCYNKMVISRLMHNLAM